MKTIADFLFEAGMLKRTPRTGFQFLGSGSESVAEHILRTAYTAFCLAHISEKADKNKLILLALFHDFLEARIGDLNYMNKKYTATDEKKAMEDAVKGLPFETDLRELFEELWEEKTLESKLVKDADNIELLLQLKEQKDLGNPYADDWIYFTLQRLVTEEGKKLAEIIINTDSTNWWFDKTSDWWINAKKEK
ncbi:MAG: HD domain-containing protein [Proteobacteria bacterium]|nr:HD domain-containing protein [Pseudomonadota bacterium]